MEIRHYQPSDLAQISQLFYDTVHTVNAADYSQEQLDVWATGQLDLKAWNESFLAHHTFVAVVSNQLVGFGDITTAGYLDRLYVHKDYQGQGIATALCHKLENAAACDLFTTHASITAKPFFERRGYRVIHEQQVSRKGVELTNYVMQKNR
ncbi:GNAT family N-acetyltransferase [Sphingobacterium paramultivorum]|uniref:GNAT family N-acetyltransferase n=1 Tax=Sphingobacterium paramultivorum TaxID=2886510 RepID=A0A7G5E1M2_9SPHI|nr:GNAT family N-acetyltransferase [Sphingobacterium paramultivorum]QMV67897.1 GNAT family N-acetyltransferase [Sphingobacterium paramultivorum]WSO16794.1 GNAT family N-acetyltransferase [Sphingobacterium paramultivorum]